uniref:Uncharacterized protein n=1 Tax=Clytia hemisphaerica TaxID=252671 RepID=A0A7M5XHM3_9CNID
DSPTECLCGIAKDVLNTSDPMKKSELTRAHYANWLKERFSVGYAQMPDQPKRQEGLQIKDPGRIKRGKGGTLESRVAMIHSLANIEQWAIDLSWDVMGRFSTVKINDKPLPMEFFDDFIKVADDEAKATFCNVERTIGNSGKLFWCIASTQWFMAVSRRDIL